MCNCLEKYNDLSFKDIDFTITEDNLKVVLWLVPWLLNPQQNQLMYTIHLLILLYVSPSLFKILEIYKLHEISYKKLHK